MSQYRLRKEFEDILAENAAKPEEEQLPLEFFDIDPDLRPMIEKEIKEEEDRIQQEMAYELEKQQVLVAKLRGNAAYEWNGLLTACACLFW